MSLTEIWFLLQSALPCDYPTHIRKQSHSTTASYWCPVQHNKLLIYLTLNLWLQSAGRTGSTEMTPVGPETGRHSQIFRRNTLERSAPNRLTSMPKPCLGSAWPQRETWFTSKDEKYWNLKHCSLWSNACSMWLFLVETGYARRIQMGSCLY